jgi:hypothetical protein
MTKDLLHVHLGATAEGIAQISPIERDHVHAGFLSNARRLGQRALYFAGNLW